MNDTLTIEQSTQFMNETAAKIKIGGGERGIERQHRHGRLTARERID